MLTNKIYSCYNENQQNYAANVEAPSTGAVSIHTHQGFISAFFPHDMHSLIFSPSNCQDPAQVAKENRLESGKPRDPHHPEATAGAKTTRPKL